MRKIIIGKQYPIDYYDSDIYVSFGSINKEGNVQISIKSGHSIEQCPFYSDKSDQKGYFARSDYVNIKDIRNYLNEIINLNGVEVQKDLSELVKRKKNMLNLCDILGSF